MAQLVERPNVGGLWELRGCSPVGQAGTTRHRFEVDLRHGAIRGARSARKTGPVVRSARWRRSSRAVLVAQ